MSTNPTIGDLDRVAAATIRVGSEQERIRSVSPDGRDRGRRDA
jgi:hypothetical protein